MCKLADLAIGESARITGFNACAENYRQKLLALGLTLGTELTLVRKAPLGDPLEITVRGFALSLRCHEAAALSLEKIATSTPAPDVTTSTITSASLSCDPLLPLRAADSDVCRIALVGNPNCGKTTLINALTGSSLRIGNWPGVTVESKRGSFTYQQQHFEVIDLPGIYSLVLSSDTCAVDEQVTNHFIFQQDYQLIINVLDAANLERNLYLTAQLLELGVPMIIVLNMMDVAKEKNHIIDVAHLQKLLGCPCVALTVNKTAEIEQLKIVILQMQQQPQMSYCRVAYPAVVERAITSLATTRIHALRALENDGELQETVVKAQQQSIFAECGEEADTLIAGSRYDFAHQIAAAVIAATEAVRQHRITAWIDSIVLNRYLGVPIFAMVIYALFLFAINIGGAFQDFFDITTAAVFVKGVAAILQQWHLPNWLVAVIAGGAGRGINTTLTFVPVIGSMFLFLAFLESSGYMTRAAFVIDRAMRGLGLPGKAFVPLIVGFGCNVPAIMAARTLESQRDRILTILMTPFMSCGARLTIYAVFVAAFFPVGGQNVVFALYVVGIAMAVFTGLMLRKTLLPGTATPLLLELPPYHRPTWRMLWLQTWGRLKRFIFKAGKLIVPLCMLLGILNNLTITGSFVDGDAHADSLLSVLGRSLTPLFAPMGIEPSNWPATVGLLTGTLAKEVVIATLNTLYLQMTHISLPAAEQFNFWQEMHAAVFSVADNLKALPSALGNPMLTSLQDSHVDAGVYGVMYQQFPSKAAAFAYLLLILLYVPCVSTIAAIAKELNIRWAAFSVVWSSLLAYGTAVLFYQIASYTQHPQYSLQWIMIIVITVLSLLFLLRLMSHRPTTRILSQGAPV